YRRADSRLPLSDCQNPGGTMRRLTTTIFAVFLLALGACAQNGGQVGIQTVNVALTQATAPGILTFTPPGGSATSVLPNIGQSSHWLSYCTGGTVTQITLRLEASFDGTNWFAISQNGTLTGCQMIEGGGYFPNVRANLVALSGTSPTVTAWYSASDSPIPSAGIAINTRYTAPVGGPFEVTSKNSGLSFFVATAFTNPGASVVAANVEEPIGGKFGWMRRARISCSAACKVAIV